ncbi:MAG: hypothetical protein ACPKPY_00925 [Nitrososphaeraceae archaeon]
MSEKTIRISEMISSDLAFRNNADSLFDKLDSSQYDKIKLDFLDVKSISRSFAHEYSIRKKNSRKIIVEVNMPKNIEKMLRIVEKIPEISECNYRG